MATRRVRSIATHITAAVVGAAVLGLVVRFSGTRVESRSPDVPSDPVSTPATSYAWTDQSDPTFPIPPYAQYLAGVKIVLDPGHGGRGDRPDWKRGPTGLREAEINLRVAQFLRGFLEAVDADVILTRQADVFLAPDISEDNAERIGLANEPRADLFLSIHHNGADSPQPNYTTVFYHGAPADSPASLCAARYLLTGVNDALRLEQHISCALLSDRELYRSGLLVLREALVPAVLTEASFHSNPVEEERLRDPVYNRREAYGLFLGLARWAQAGLPCVELLSARNGRQRGHSIQVVLDDGLSKRGGWGSDSPKISADSLVVKIDDEPVSFTLDLKNNRLRIALPRKLKARKLRLFVDFENVFGQHVLHPRIDVKVGAG